ncbi:50S ribosomal protein L22 [Marinoscillum furvescens]|uniref:Large ribosomal subunit protein uL22 n=1 Tax=Marinoscillum furvescens DSM 4134 TaxID=1122208 RepID=A0A3D9L661_MARFU|nr:50S ribosomal protein L22 [Marinoscillum furvescens]RED99491.1 LSU ribosomal protein L22P [Marinoscillum furvescens DSM 4134]
METAEKKLKKSVRIRLQKEAIKKHKEENSGKLGAVKASLRNVPTAPRKMRLVADMIRGQRVNLALNILKFDNKHASKTMEKLLMTAIADWQAQNEDVSIEDADLVVKEVFVDGGRILKRLRPAPQGRAHRIRKRSNHITITVADANENKVQSEEKESK